MQTSECSPFKLPTMKAFCMLILGVLGASYSHRDQQEITRDWCTVGLTFKIFYYNFRPAPSLSDVSKGNYGGNSTAKYGCFGNECPNTKVHSLVANRILLFLILTFQPRWQSQSLLTNVSLEFSFILCPSFLLDITENKIF